MKKNVGKFTTRVFLLVSFLLTLVFGSFVATQTAPKAQAASTTPIHAGDSWKGTENYFDGETYPATLKITSINPNQEDPITGYWNWDMSNEPYPIVFSGTEETYAQAYPGSLTDVINVWGYSPVDRYISFKMTGTKLGYIVEGTNGDLKGIYTGLGADEWLAKFSLTKVTPARKNLVVVVDGIGSALTSSQANGRGKDGTDYQNGCLIPCYGFFLNSGSISGIVPFLQNNSATYKNARVIVYSYAGYHDNGQPNAYTCRDTFVNPLVKDAQRLADQINAALKSDPNQDITLLGHSQGGLVLLTYITALVANNGSVHGLPTGAHLKYAATFDSPDAGVSDAASYRKDAEGFYRGKLGCSSLTSKDKLVSLDNMQAIYKTATNKDARGETASILSALLKGKNTKTQDVLRQAKKQFGLSFMTFANLNDLLWLPGACKQNVQNFQSTAWVADGGSNSGIYRRTLSLGNYTGCVYFWLDKNINLALGLANHFQVLNNTFVERALLEFVEGKTPDNY